MKVIQAKSAGFCYGVKRAVEIAEQSAAEYGVCYTLGDIIHNSRVVADLRSKGVYSVNSIDEIPPESAVIIRSHGAPEAVHDAVRSAGQRLLDATCPCVVKIHKIVRDASNRRRMVIIIGSVEHPEINAIRGWAEDSIVAKDCKELSEMVDDGTIDADMPLSIVSQTTESEKNVKKCVEIIKKECTNYEIFDTICDATSRRQNEAEMLSRVCGAVIVIGDKKSANTSRLAEICAENCPKVICIDSSEMLDLSGLEGVDMLAVTAGASTPAWIIKEVHQRMTDEIKDIEIAENTENTEIAAAAENSQNSQSEAVPTSEHAGIESIPEDRGNDASTKEDSTPEEENPDETFDEMLAKNFKTLSTGEKVSGIVQSISATEVSVDLGTKHSGYIPISELTDDPDLKPEDIAPVGSEIETYVLRVNDVEGTVMLSKKRLDTVKNWEIIEAAKNDRTTLEGTVIEENKGGIIVLVKGIRVFVPASQSGLPKGSEMSTLVRTRQKLRVTEVNHSRRRVVGSIRAVQFELKKQAAEKTWDEIDVGKVYNGTVKSTTSYGAFVDIGGVDGMVHVSELSWRRIKNPSEVVKVGDNIEVFVISFDKENRKISLGYKKAEENPWTKFTSNYSVGSIASVKIVKLMQFGAFAEILPGVDGLIHVSQITSERRIGKPSEVLQEGQEVQVRITNIDYEKQKVSLSIRAVQDEPVQSEDSGDDSNSAQVIVYDTENPAGEVAMD